MEISTQCKFITDFYGGKSYLPGSQIIKNWLEAQRDRLLNPKLKELKDALGNEEELEKILCVFNSDSNSYPAIGDWMLFECARNAAKLANTWGRFGVSADTWKDYVKFSPSTVNLYNGQIIKQAQGVEGYPITTKIGGRRVSFFKAYQLIRAGATFQFTMSYPEDLCTKIEGKGKDKAIVPDPEKSSECAKAVISKMGNIGLGAYRIRFGKFIIE